MKDDFLKTAPPSATDKQNEKIALFYSATMAQEFGHDIYSIPDGKGGRREGAITAIDAPDEYTVKDRIVVFEGSLADIKYVKSFLTPAEQTHREMRDRLHEEMQRHFRLKNDMTRGK